MKKVWTSFIALSLTAGVASIAFAQTSDAQGREAWKAEKFSQLDKDQDGRLTVDEATADHRQKLIAADTDRDGSLSQDELQAIPPERQGAGKGERWQKLDVNGDGELSRDEASRMPPERFDKLDQDGNGSLSRAELEAAHAGKRAEAHRGGKLGHLDQNGDGTVTVQEAEQSVVERFTRSDTNGDGYITLDEFAIHGGCGGHRGGHDKTQGRGNRGA